MSDDAPSKASYEICELTTPEYHKLADETMHSLLDSLEEIYETNGTSEWDIEYESGVLTFKMGDDGTYVINKQPPNKQIWLSSPFSGPKRFDYDASHGAWFYSRDNATLHGLLEEELSTVIGERVDLSRTRRDHDS